MKIGIISDTHDHHKNVLEAVEIFKSFNVNYIFHAGDIVSPFTTKSFGEVTSAKFIAVFGNCDGEKLHLTRTVNGFGGEIYEHTYTGKAGGRQIFMTHVPDMLEEVAGSGKFDLRFSDRSDGS